MLLIGTTYDVDAYLGAQSRAPSAAEARAVVENPALAKRRVHQYS